MGSILCLWSSCKNSVCCFRGRSFSTARSVSWSRWSCCDLKWRHGGFGTFRRWCSGRWESLALLDHGYQLFWSYLWQQMAGRSVLKFCTCSRGFWQSKKYVTRFLTGREQKWYPLMCKWFLMVGISLGSKIGFELVMARGRVFGSEQLA